MEIINDIIIKNTDIVETENLSSVAENSVEMTPEISEKLSSPVLFDSADSVLSGMLEKRKAEDDMLRKLEKLNMEKSKNHEILTKEIYQLNLDIKRKRLELDAEACAELRPVVRDLLQKWMETDITIMDADEFENYIFDNNMVFDKLDNYDCTPVPLDGIFAIDKARTALSLYDAICKNKEHAHEEKWACIDKVPGFLFEYDVFNHVHRRSEYRHKIYYNKEMQLIAFNNRLDNPFYHNSIWDMSYVRWSDYGHDEWNRPKTLCADTCMMFMAYPMAEVYDGVLCELSSYIPRKRKSTGMNHIIYQYSPFGVIIYYAWSDCEDEHAPLIKKNDELTTALENDDIRALLMNNDVVEMLKNGGAKALLDAVSQKGLPQK